MPDEAEIDYDGVLIGTVAKKDRELVCVGVREYQGHRFIDVRIYFLAEDEWRPSRKGITIPIEAYPEFAAAVGEAGSALGFDVE